MRLAFFLDNRGFAAKGPLGDPRLGNPGIGGTEFAFLASVALLAADPEACEPLLFLTAPQAVAGLDGPIRQVSGLAEALAEAEAAGAVGLVFRPGRVSPADQRVLIQSRLPLVAWCHNLGCDQQGFFEGLPALKRWVLVSGAQLDAFRHSRLVRRACVIPNPVLVPPDLEQGASPKDLAYVGAITPFKAFDRIARIWPEIARACPEARLRVFGGADLYAGGGASALTPYERYCRVLLDRGCFSDRVVFEGSLGLERYAAFADVAVGVVNPSGRDETFCLSAAEFSACGIPVVAPRRHALVQTVLDGTTGLLASSDQEFAAHCIALLQDPHRCLRLGQAGRSHMQLAFGSGQLTSLWTQLAAELKADLQVVPTPPSTPWWHEGRWLRELWGLALACPLWPSWPVLKSGLKGLVQGSRQAITPAGVGVLSTLAALAVMLFVVFGKYGGNPTGLARIGDQFPLSPRVAAQELVILAGKRGNDGQQYLALAMDPWQADPGTSQALDNPIYRGKRLLYPLLAWVLGFGQSGLIAWALAGLNVVAIGCAAALVALWAQQHQLTPQWGFAALLLPGYWVTLSLDTADLLATVGLLAAAVTWTAKQRGATSLALAAALLSRETSLLAWASTGLSVLWQRRWTWLLPLACVPLPLLLWTQVLNSRFAQTRDGLLASVHFGWPGVGLLQKLGQLLGLYALPGPAPSLLERLFDAASLSLWGTTLLMLASVALSPRTSRWLRLTSAIYLLPALCTSTQILARFPDYTRVWIDLASLALLGLLQLRSRWLKPWLAGCGCISLGYWAGYCFIAQ